MRLKITHCLINIKSFITLRIYMRILRNRPSSEKNVDLITYENTFFLLMSSSFRRGLNEILALPGYYAA